MIKAHVTNKTYNKKCLSVATKLKHYWTVTLPQVTYACETIFNTTNTITIDKVLKLERIIIWTCLNKNYRVDGVWSLPSNETVYKEMEPVRSTMIQNRISFLGHLLRSPKNRISGRRIEKLWDNKNKIRWIEELKDYTRRFKIQDWQDNKKQIHCTIAKKQQTEQKESSQRKKEDDILKEWRIGLKRRKTRNLPWLKWSSGGHEIEIIILIISYITLKTWLDIAN